MTPEHTSAVSSACFQSLSMPNRAPDQHHSVRVLRRFFNRRLKTTDGVPTGSDDRSEPSQIVSYLTQRALARASLRAAMHTPPASSPSWKNILMRAALTELKTLGG